VREALFNILGAEVRGAVVLDLFAGAGTVGFEALSRGAAWVTFVERDRLAIGAITATAAALGCGGRCTIIPGEVGRWLDGQDAKPGAADICYVDAPYQDNGVDAVLSRLARDPPRVVVCEHHRTRRLAERVGALERSREATYGLTHLTFYRPATGRGAPGGQHRD
jgi:16S rRNA (guanine(966)-N(2))-methyltransferase RsmD